MLARPRPTVYSKRDENKVGQPLTCTDGPNVISQPLLLYRPIDRPTHRRLSTK